MAIIRLQGDKWHAVKEFMTIVSYSTSDKGHIRIDCENPFGRKFCHYLNPEEQKAFELIKNQYPVTVFKPRKKPRGI